MAPWTDSSIVMVQTSGGDQLTLPNGVKCDTDTVEDLSLWNINMQSTTVTAPITPIAVATPSVDVVAPQASSIVQTNVPAASTNILSSIMKIAEPIMPFVVQIVKMLFHIK
jgi:hypothetical protein